MKLHPVLNRCKVVLIYILFMSQSFAQQNVTTGGFIIGFKNDVTLEKQKRIINTIPQLKKADKSLFMKSQNVTVVTIEQNKNATDVDIREIMNKIELFDEVSYVNPLFVSENGHFAGTLGEFFVKLRSADDFDKLQQLASETKTKIIREYEYMPDVYILFADKHSAGNAKEMAKRFQKTGLFKYASANSIFSLIATRNVETRPCLRDASAGKHASSLHSNDPNFAWQWSLLNDGSPLQYSGTPDADMDVDSAWTITTGDSTIKIAVLDSGVDTLHPDLVDNLLPGFDATGGSSKGYPNTNFPEDGHGTSCAGIIAAKGDNGIGTAGVAYNCKIIPVKIFSYINMSGNIIPYSTAQMGADGINWAYQTAGADILSNSWGLTDSLIAAFNIDTVFGNDVINQAATNGRGGKGLPILFSAGNEPDPFTIWPANLSGTIAVAATTMCDELKTSNDCSPENWWSSNYGTNLDISAPGVRIATSDMVGANGFSSGDINFVFNGTSAACPNAAGVMALILSVNNGLSGVQARYVLESTCDTVGGYSYNVNNQSGRWSQELGYGRVNAYRAVQAAMAFVGIDKENVSDNINFYTYSDESGKNYIHYVLESRKTVLIEVHDILGRKVQTIADEFQDKGVYNTNISTSVKYPGIYFVKLIVEGRSYTKTIREFPHQPW